MQSPNATYALTSNEMLKLNGTFVCALKIGPNNKKLLAIYLHGRKYYVSDNPAILYKVNEHNTNLY
jgi:hypothetical protein